MQNEITQIREKMKEFYDIVPNADELISLQQKELAGKLILILRKLEEPIDPSAIVAEIPFSAPLAGITDGYPEKYQNEISEALNDAFRWLEENGLTERSDKYPEPTELLVLSKRAKEIRSEEDFQKLILWQSVNESMLHPRIANKVVTHLARGEHSDAMGFAMRSVEIAVREACGLGFEDYGVKLMHKAFGKDGPLRNGHADEGEEDGLKLLFAGAIGVFKNPHSHRDVHVEHVTEALTIVLFASHLMGIVDSRKPQE